MPDQDVPDPIRICIAALVAHSRAHGGACEIRGVDVDDAWSYGPGVTRGWPILYGTLQQPALWPHETRVVLTPRAMAAAMHAAAPDGGYTVDGVLCPVCHREAVYAAVFSQASVADGVLRTSADRSGSVIHASGSRTCVVLDVGPVRKALGLPRSL